MGDHVAGAGTHAVDVFGKVEGLCEERIAGNGAVGTAKVIKGERGWEGSGVPDFEPVGEEHDLDAAVAVVVAVGDGVDDGLGHNVARDFVFDWRLCALFAGADADVDLGHDKVDGLVDELEGGALVNLVGGDRLGDLSAVEVSALDL